MGDFLLDLRPPARRVLSRTAQYLRFADDTRVVVIDRPEFGLVVTHTGAPSLWDPYHDASGSLVAVAGRLVCDEDEWNAASSLQAPGGVASRLLHEQYRTQGESALERVNGNCAVILYDAAIRRLHLVTDRAGVLPVFQVAANDGLLYGSHPDVLADTAGERNRLDEVSLTDLVLSGTVTPPYTFYERVRATETGSILTFDVGPGRPTQPTVRRHFEFAYRGDERLKEPELADQLTNAVRRAVQRRTLPRLGTVAVALSGGLDSRVVLSSIADKAGTFSFTCFDTPNRELQAAGAIARALGARFLPLERGPEYYGDNAEQGVRISGGMGTFANNHFLGVLPRLKAEGMQNLLTGCYADYLFKALPLNRREHWLTRRQTLGPFRQEFYFDHFGAETPLARRAAERREHRIPAELRRQDTPAGVFQLEVRRTVPLCYEGDNQQRLVPQRLTGWSPPFVDRDVLDVYCRIPYELKLNRSVFRRVVWTLAGESLEVPDANTGAAPDASRGREVLCVSRLRLQRAWRRFTGTPTSEESWPNWHQYVRRSRKLDALWRRPNPQATDILRRIVGARVVAGDVEGLKRERPFLFVGMLSAKLWLDQRG